MEEYLGEDASKMFKSDEIHAHSENARALLPSMQVGELVGVSFANAPSRIQEAQELAKKVIDPSKPYTFQVGKLGSHYQDWVHAPIHTEEPLVLLGGWMEPFTKVWLVFLLHVVRCLVSCLFFKRCIGGYRWCSGYLL